MSYIDTYELATFGQNLTNTFTLSSNGILIDVFIEDLPPIVIPPDFGGIMPGQEWPPSTKEREKKRKRITVVAVINDKEYKETKIVEDMPSLTVNNVDVDIQFNDNQPFIKISLKS